MAAWVREFPGSPDTETFYMPRYSSQWILWIALSTVP